SRATHRARRRSVREEAIGIIGVGVTGRPAGADSVPAQALTVQRNPLDAIIRSFPSGVKGLNAIDSAQHKGSAKFERTPGRNWVKWEHVPCRGGAETKCR